MTEVDTAGDAPATAGAPPAPGPDASLVTSLVAVVVTGGGLVVAARYSALALLVAVAVVQGLVAITWVLGTALPGRKGALVVAALAAAGADTVVSVWPHGRLGAQLAVLGLAVPVMFVHQLLRGAARSRIVASLSSVALLVVTVVALPAVIQMRHEFSPPSLGGAVVEAVMGSIATALVVGYLVDLVVPVPRFDPQVPRGMLAVLGSAVAGGAVGYLVLHAHAEFTGGRSTFAGAALGAVAALVAVGVAFAVHAAAPPFGRLGVVSRPVCAGLVPLCLLAPGAFLLCLAVRV